MRLSRMAEDAMAELRCARCGSAPGPAGPGQRVASVSGSILGDECTETWYYGSGCNACTVEIYRDVLLGENSVSINGPVAREEGDSQIALIRQCATPGSRAVVARHIAPALVTSWIRDRSECLNPAS